MTNKNQSVQKGRRTFLKWLGAGLVLSGSGFTIYKLTSPFEKGIASVITKDTAGLKVKKEDIVAFSILAAKENPWNFGSKAKKLINLYGSLNTKILPLPFKAEFNEYRNDITRRFLLSTDFFINKMNEDKEIRFVGKVWTPYAMPCMNPFSSLFYPSI